MTKSQSDGDASQQAGNGEQNMALVGSNRAQDASVDAGAQTAAEPTRNPAPGPLPSVNSEHKVRADLLQEEIVRGSHPGDRYIRHAHTVGPFRRKRAGRLTASLAADQPRTGIGRMLARVKQTLL